MSNVLMATMDHNNAMLNHSGGQVGVIHNQDSYYSYYEYEDGDWEDYRHTSHYYQIFPFEIPLYGYVWPVIVIFMSCCNLLVIGAFLRKHMRNATNVVLVSIAISDSLTGLVTLPASVHIFVQANENLTAEWCNGAMISRLYISRAFHTVSVWQTLLLAVQRFCQVRYPLHAAKYCNLRNTVMAIIVIYVLPFVLHVFHAFDIKTSHGYCRWNIPYPCGWTCVYIWCALIFGHLLPSLALIITAVLMVRSIRGLVASNMEPESSTRKQEDKKVVTVVVILIVTIFLIPELPYGLFYLITLFLTHSNRRIFPLETNRIIHGVYEVLLVVSFHLNFWVYCVMYRHFRRWIKGLFRVVTCKHHDERSVSLDNDIELGNITTMVDQSRDNNDSNYNDDNKP